jgi:hypothetical protein
MTISKAAARDAQASSTEISFATETPVQQARHREIARRYRRRRRGGPKKNVRICELQRVFADRHGPVLPGDDAGLDAVFVMANHLAHLDAPDRRISAWARLRAPWMGDDETAELIQMVVPKPLKWRADKLAERLRLDYATRTRLGITTIGAVDCKKAKRARLRRKRAAAREKARRARAGAAPHGGSVEQTEPWKALGISRRTWYRRRRNGTDGTNSCAAYPTDIVVDTKQCQGAPPPSRGGSWARAVPAVSAVETAISPETVYPDRIFPTAAREVIPSRSRHQCNAM